MPVADMPIMYDGSEGKMPMSNSYLFSILTYKPQSIVKLNATKCSSVSQKREFVSEL